MVWLVIQTALSLFALRLLLRVILPGLERVPDRGHLLDVWIPIALIAPMACFGGLAGGGSVSIAWVAIGGPVVVGMMAIGAAMVTSNASATELHLSGRAAAAWLGAGVLLVLLACAHDLTAWIGQCAFAIGAVLLWMNAPDPVEEGGDRGTADRVGWAMLIVLACSAGAATAAVLAGPNRAPVSGAVTLAVAAMTVAAATRLDGGTSALRLGAWCGVYGVLFGLGVMSLSVLVPESFQLLRQGEIGAVRRASYGFSAYAVEGVVLVLLPLIPAAARRLAPGWRRMGGVLLLIAAATLAAARLAALPA